MSSVIVGLFDTQAAANEARTHLLSAGFAADSVLSTGGAGSTSEGAAKRGDLAAGRETGSAVAETAHHAEGAISRFFHHLFGGAADDRDTERSSYAETYDEAFRRGSYGVSVNVEDDDETDRAERILNDAGAVDIDEKAASWRQEGWTGAGSTALGAAALGTPADTVSPDATQKLHEVEEELRVGKRAVARGGLRVFKRLIETPVAESVRLREEHATIERRAVDRPATAADFAAFEEGSIEVRETGEEAVVSKTARVTGEVEIGKTVTEREEVVRDTVRRTQVEVEELAGGVEAHRATTHDAGAGPVGTTGGFDTTTGADPGRTTANGNRLP